VLAGLLIFFLPTRRRNLFAMLALLIVAVAAGLSGCGGSANPPAVNGTGAFTFTVTGTDAATGKIVSSTVVTVNVQ